MPSWARIAVPTLLLIGVVAAVVVALWPRPEPVDIARSICLSGIRAELEARDRAVIDMPLLSDVDAAGDDTYRTQGSIAFREADGEERRVDVRCIVRVEDGSLRVASIRFSS